MCLLPTTGWLKSLVHSLGWTSKRLCLTAVGHCWWCLSWTAEHTCINTVNKYQLVYSFYKYSPRLLSENIVKWQRKIRFTISLRHKYKVELQSVKIHKGTKSSCDAQQSMVEPPQRPSAGAMGHHPRCFARSISSHKLHKCYWEKRSNYITLLEWFYNKAGG